MLSIVRRSEGGNATEGRESFGSALRRNLYFLLSVTKSFNVAEADM